ncbi:SpoIIIAH-like family protein [Paenibacillus sp.]|jgi:stage III sporulation protein AH|uniref:SpoIIIAH-like family protein n=1 Tax=Paenibacillus sp. TaxID=58172 RepID=UPI0028216BF4|nr:SpoIIIAH-like family protein [Paenibacillus sp.]MDR0267046.1 SpoIIIAH-like family protein [Paenibacillus sp.]
MNSKRQTIWLVSMLSLMVMLSAYYLFTEDSGTSKTPVAEQVTSADKTPAKGTTAETKENEVSVTEVITDGKVNDNAAAAKTDTSSKDASKDTAKNTSKDTTKETVKDTTKDNADKTTAKTDGKDQQDQAAPDKTASTGKADGKGQNGKSDAEVLKEVAAQTQKSSGSGQIDDLLFKRSQDNVKKYNDLMAAMNDMSKDPAETAKASDELSALETKVNKIEGIEEELEQKYSFANAVVNEENEKFKVLVLSDKPDVKQAVSIVQLVMKELNVTQDKVSVQYMAP